MSKAFPTFPDSSKYYIIYDIEDTYNLELSEDQFDELSKLTVSQLFLIQFLLARADRQKRG